MSFAFGHVPPARAWWSRRESHPGPNQSSCAPMGRNWNQAIRIPRKDLPSRNRGSSPLFRMERRGWLTAAAPARATGPGPPYFAPAVLRRVSGSASLILSSLRSPRCDDQSLSFDPSETGGAILPPGFAVFVVGPPARGHSTSLAQRPRIEPTGRGSRHGTPAPWSLSVIGRPA